VYPENCFVSLNVHLIRAEKIRWDGQGNVTMSYEQAFVTFLKNSSFFFFIRLGSLLFLKVLSSKMDQAEIRLFR
jgi:hypothetical protein